MPRRWCVKASAGIKSSKGYYVDGRDACPGSIAQSLQARASRLTVQGRHIQCSAWAQHTSAVLHCLKEGVRSQDRQDELERGRTILRQRLMWRESILFNHICGGAEVTIGRSFKAAFSLAIWYDRSTLITFTWLLTNFVDLAYVHCSSRNTGRY